MSTGTTYITFGEEDVELQINYEATPYRPAVWYLSNGDPGYPEEGGDFDIYEIIVNGENIISSFSEEEMERITEAAINSLERDDY